MLTTQSREASRGGESQNGSTIVRQVEKTPPAENDTLWARRSRDEVELLQDAIASAAERLGAGADTAISALQQTQDSFDSFESRYNSAVDRFTKSVKAAMAEAKEFRDQLNAAMSVALMAVGGPEVIAAAVITQGKELLEAGKKVGDVLEKVQKIQTALGSKPAESEPAEVKAGPADTDWKTLLRTTLTTFSSYLKQNKSLSAMNTDCTKSVRFLTNVVEGKSVPNAKGSPEGIKADKVAVAAKPSILELKSLQGPPLSKPCTDFQTLSKTRLGAPSDLKLEQDIVIRWIATMSPAQMGAMKDIEGYLTMIQILGDGGRLGTDFNVLATTDHDLELLRLRSSFESQAMSLLGQSVEWLGTGSGIGMVKDGNGQHWRAELRGPLVPEGGGYCTVSAYEIESLDSNERSNWSHPGANTLKAALRDKVVLRVRPSTTLGGGATADGPVIRQR
jgi:hypothetical protein